MIRFVYFYAMPGLVDAQYHTVKTDIATFHSVGVNFNDKSQVIDIARQYWMDGEIDMIELCGGLANANMVSAVKEATDYQVAVGQVMYGPEFRRPLVDLLKL